MGLPPTDVLSCDVNAPGQVSLSAVEQYLDYMRAMTLIQQQQHAGHHSNLPKPASFDDAETLHSRVAKTNTWPMRPNRDSGSLPGPAEMQQRPPASVLGHMTATDLEFSQYVDSIQRKAARGLAASARGSGPPRTRGSIDNNPWSVGDSAMAWPPFGVNFDRFDFHQFPTSARNKAQCCLLGAICSYSIELPLVSYIQTIIGLHYLRSECSGIYIHAIKQ